jgi:predicted dehydrogenase
MTKKSTSTHRSPLSLDRRDFLVSTAALASAAVAPSLTRSQAANLPKYRVAVIGHTGRGNYGHGLDTVWLEVPNVQIVAVADADPQGLAKAVTRLKAAKGYADYRQMLDEVKPDLVSIAPRWIDQHRDMVVGAAERNVRGIYLEKPLCRTLAEADEMVVACEKNRVKLAVSHQTRYSPRLAAVRELIVSGKIGRVLEIRGRGKEDSRGGGEDLWVLGSHVLDLIHALGGDPQWCFGRVYQAGRPITKADVKPGNEGIGPLAGDEVHAIYRLADGLTAHFDSVRGAGAKPSRFGVRICGTQGVISLGTGYLPPAYLLPDPGWSDGTSDQRWVPITSAGLGQPEPLKDTELHGGNLLAAQDLIASIEEDRQPISSLYEARTATEMIVAVFESQRLGVPASIPLKFRQNPLTLLP